MEKFPRLVALLLALLLLACGCRASPVPASATPAGGGPLRRFVGGGYAYVPRGAEVQVIDVRDPGRPNVVASWDAPSVVARIRVQGQIAYVAHVTGRDAEGRDGKGGVQIVNVANPLRPVILGGFPAEDEAGGVAIQGDVMYVGCWYKTRIVDVRRPAAPVEIGEIALPATGFEIAGNRLAAIAGAAGMRGASSARFWLADIQDPRHPIPLGEAANKRMPGWQISLVGRYAYVAGLGFWTVNIADPNAPTLGAVFAKNGGYYQAAIDNSEAYLFVAADELYVYDLGTAPDLAEVSRFNLSIHPGSSAFSMSDMAFLDGYLYLVSNTGGLTIVDVRDPKRLVPAGSAGPTPFPLPMPSPAGTPHLPPTRVPEPTPFPTDAGGPARSSSAGSLFAGGLTLLRSVLAALVAPVASAASASSPAACDRFGDPESRLASATQEPLAPDPSFPALASPRQPGHAVHTLYVDATVARLAADGGFDTVVQAFPWRDLNPEPGRYTWAAADDMARNAAAAGLNLVVRLDMPPDWAHTTAGTGLPFDLAAYADFVGAVAARYRGHIAGFIIWNEPNLAAEWSRSGSGSPDHWYSLEGGVADPADYVGVLGVAYRRIRAADPAALVVAAGLAPTGENSPRARDDLGYLAAMLDAGAAGCADAFAEHAYAYGRDPGQPDLPSLQPGLERVTAVHDLLRQRGVEVPVWLTELGYSVTEGSQPAVTLEQQADYLAAAVRRAGAEWPWVQMLTVWNLSYGSRPGDDAAGFSILNADATPRPAYARLQALLGAERRHAVKLP